MSELGAILVDLGQVNRSGISSSSFFFFSPSLFLLLSHLSSSFISLSLLCFCGQDGDRTFSMKSKLLFVSLPFSLSPSSPSISPLPTPTLISLSPYTLISLSISFHLSTSLSPHIPFLPYPPLPTLPQHPTEQALFDLMSAADDDGSGTIEFAEFLHLISLQKEQAQKMGDESDVCTHILTTSISFDELFYLSRPRPLFLSPHLPHYLPLNLYLPSPTLSLSIPLTQFSLLNAMQWMPLSPWEGSVTRRARSPLVF